MALKLKFTELKGPAFFKAETLVRIQLQETWDHQDLVSKLLKWQGDNKVYSQGGGTTGGGIAILYFTPDDAEQVRAFLASLGIAHVPDADVFADMIA